MPTLLRRPALHRRRPQGVPRAPRRPAARARLAARALAAARPARDAADGRARVAARARRAGRPRRAEAGRVRRRLRLRLRVAARLRVGPALDGLRPDVRAPSTARAASRACRARRTTSCRASRGSTAPIGAMQAGRQRRGRVRRARRTPGTSTQNGAATMPFCVLLEAALQPCGWLASLRRQRAHDRDGPPLPQPRRHRDAARRRSSPTAGTLRTRGEDHVDLAVGGDDHRGLRRRVLRRRAARLRDEHRLRVLPEGGVREPGRAPRLTPRSARASTAPSRRPRSTSRARPARYCDGAPRLPGDDAADARSRHRLVGPRAAQAGSARCAPRRTSIPASGSSRRTSSRTRCSPARSASRRCASCCSSCMLERGMADGHRPAALRAARCSGAPLTWKYRGQVVPANRTITTRARDHRGRRRRARALRGRRRLAVGRRQAHLRSARTSACGIVAGAAPRPTPTTATTRSLDPAVDTWLGDHRPTWTMPALPMMSMVDRLARAVARRTGRAVVALRDVQVLRWLPFPGGPVRLRTEVSGSGDVHAATLLAWREAARSPRSRASSRSRARSVLLAPTRPRLPPLAPLDEHATAPVDDPYAAGALFHGPAFQYLPRAAPGPARRLGRARRGARAACRAALLHQGLLDAATHAIPHDELWRWSSEIPRDVVAYPYRIPRSGCSRRCRIAARCGSRCASPGSTAIRASRPSTSRSLDGDRLLVALRLVEVLLPKGPIGTRPVSIAPRLPARPDATSRASALSRVDGEATVLERGRAPRQRLAARQRGAHLRRSLLARCRAARGGRRPRPRRAEGVRAPVGAPRWRGSGAPLRRARGDAAAAPAPGAGGAGRRGRARRRRGTARPGSASRCARTGASASASARGRSRISTTASIERFVGDVVIADPDAFAAVRGRSCLYLGNHQVGVESLLFSVLLSALSGTPTRDARQGRAPDELARHADRAQLRLPGRDRPAADHLLRSRGPRVAARRSSARSPRRCVPGRRAPWSTSRARARSPAAAPSRR